MNEENNTNQPTRQFIIDEEYVVNILQDVFDAEFTNDQWEEIFDDRLGDPIYCAVYDTIQEMLEYTELLERSKDAEKQNPHFVVKWKNPNAFVNDFRIMGYFKTEEDAQQRIRYEQCITEFDEWKIEKVTTK